MSIHDEYENVPPMIPSSAEEVQVFSDILDRHTREDALKILMGTFEEIWRDGYVSGRKDKW